ncbi:MAG: hypothetical protein AB8I08_15985 [Sandaracinaceae bacterium]
MARAIAAFLMALAGFGCVQLPEGQILCGPPPDLSCPGGWTCHPGDVCLPGPAPDAGPDGGDPDAELSLEVIATFNGARLDLASDVAVVGNKAYVTGFFSGSTRFGAQGTREAGETAHAYLARVDREGLVEMLTTARSDELTTFNAVTANNDEVVVIGVFGGEFDLGNGVTLSAGELTRSVAIVGYDASLTAQWATALVPSEDDAMVPSSIAFAGERVRVAGTYGGAIGELLPEPTGPLAGFVATLQLDHAAEPVRTFAVADGVFGLSASGGDNDLFGVGGTRNGNGFVAAFSGSRTLQWEAEIGGPSEDAVRAVTRSGETICFVLESGSQGIVFDRITVAPGGAVGLVQCRNRSGDVSWTKFLSGDNPAAVRPTDVLASGDSLWVAGTFTARVDFGLGLLTSTAAQDLFLLEFDLFSGALRRQFTLGGAGNEEPRGLDVGLDGSVWVVGTYEETIESASGTIAADGALDAFVAIVDREGAQ